MTSKEVIARLKAATEADVTTNPDSNLWFFVAATPVSILHLAVSAEPNGAFWLVTTETEDGPVVLNVEVSASEIYIAGARKG